jgi:DNA invertase Pin-like site-specific DNA recombinase
MVITLPPTTAAPQRGRQVPHTRTGLRWAIYCRISGRQGVRTGDDDEDTVSLDTQESANRELVGRLDPSGTIVEALVLREVHTGVELFTRPKLTRLREAIRRGEVDAVACYQPKRWTRDPDHAGYLRSELREHRVLLRFALDDPGDDEAGALVGYVQHWSGKQEHKSISEQTHRARAHLVHLGHAWAGCKAPYGLRWRFETIQHHDGCVEHKRIGWDADPAESAIVAGLFAGLLAGKTLRRRAQANRLGC